MINKKEMLIMQAQVKEIKVKTKADEYPDLSYLGKFSDNPNEFAVEHHGGRGAYKFFNAENVENQEQAEENYKRMMDFEKGNVILTGIVAECEILVPRDGHIFITQHIPRDGHIFITQHITSGGLWGIESDLPKEQKDEIKKEQLEELKYVLKILCVEGIEEAEIKYEE